MWSGDFQFKDLIMSIFNSQLELLKKGVFGHFMELVILVLWQRFSKYNVNVVATEQERQNYTVALQFIDDSGSCSFSVALPFRLLDHIVDIEEHIAQ
ncbi:hypothetical protein K7X08_024566 [Anisodus acutangulus]|uniref:Uncharacterized protein n=1 Tax=Anisodus acutangulus TaxID=402998 RepID=A0A9Q1M823_9SOLA|nr:hypothetical protein K7X08_024566 [Anisodus acutangulus]